MRNSIGRRSNNIGNTAGRQPKVVSAKTIMGVAMLSAFGLPTPSAAVTLETAVPITDPDYDLTALGSKAAFGIVMSAIRQQSDIRQAYRRDQLNGANPIPAHVRLQPATTFDQLAAETGFVQDPSLLTAEQQSEH